MSIQELTEKVNKMHQVWEQYKSVNDFRIEEEKRKNHADPLTMHQLEKINRALDENSREISSIKTYLDRPSLATKSAGFELQVDSKAFVQYLRKGVEHDLLALEKKSINSSYDRENGFLVSKYTSNLVEQQLSEASPMRRIAKVTEISTDALEIIDDKVEAFAGWSQDAEGLNETNAPNIGKKVIPVHELYAQPKATQKLIDDPQIDIEAWLSEKLVDVFTRKENAAFINGDGIGKPKGILSYGADQVEQIASSTPGKVSADDIMMLFFSLKECYAVNGKFLMSRDAVQTIRMLKDEHGRYIWQPGFDAKTPDTILGAEVVLSADMPTIASNNLTIAFADFSKAYQVVDRSGIRILRDPFTNKPFIKFYTTKRVGGDVVNAEAIKLLKVSNS